MTPTPTDATTWPQVHSTLRAAPSSVGRVAIRLQRRLAVESIANIRSIRPEVPQPLFPPRRRILGPALQQRLDRVARAVAVLDPSLDPTPDTLRLAHGLVAGNDVTEVGRFRSSPIAFQAGNPFTGASFADVPTFVERALSEMNRMRDVGWVDASAHLFVRLLQIHPFTDGNGRVARLVVDLEQRRAVDSALGPGVDLWAPWRRSYLAALHACDPAGGLDAFDRGDPGPFERWVRERSDEGAVLWLARLRTIGTLHERLATALDVDTVGTSPSDADVALAVVIDRNVTPAELDDLVADDPAGASRRTTGSINALVADDLLLWDRRGLLQPTRRLAEVLSDRG